MFLAKRRAILPAQRIKAGEAAKQLLVNNSLFQQSQKIACYLGQEDEFDCLPIIQEIWQCGKKCFLPVVSSIDKKHLGFAPYQKDEPLRLNRYKILEPESTERLSTEQLDLVIVPLVAFDLLGHRVGMGGGYYDRTFEFKHKETKDKPFLLGLGYELQLIFALPSESWDVLLDGILTEEKLYLELA